MKKILLATTNKGKFAEFKAMLDADVQWLTLADFPGIEEVPEDGQTFVENARKKALGYAQATNLWTLADDSGLCIDALNGAPGVNSARFSGEKDPNETRSLIDHRNIEKVLTLLKDVPYERRTARFVCCLCLAAPGRVLAETTGIWNGVILDEQRGYEGFGYDPIMYVPDLKKTVGQMSAPQKNTLSHRSQAIAQLKPFLTSLLAGS